MPFSSTSWSEVLVRAVAGRGNVAFQWLPSLELAGRDVDEVIAWVQVGELVVTIAVGGSSRNRGRHAEGIADVIQFHVHVCRSRLGAILDAVVGDTADASNVEPDAVTNSNQLGEAEVSSEVDVIVVERAGVIRLIFADNFSVG